MTMKNNNKKPRYYIVRKSRYVKYLNTSQTKWEYMYREHGVYTYSFEDAVIFLRKELINYFCENNLKNLCISDRKNKLYQFYKKFKIFDLYKQVDLGKECYDEYPIYFSSLERKKIDLKFGYPYSESAKIYILNSYKLIKEVAEWNGVRCNLSFSYPVFTEGKEYNYWKRQHRPCFHNRKYCQYRTLRISKSEYIAGTDPEYQCYLSARQKNREATQNIKPTHNGKRFQIPGDWKHYHKCRKQWAKNIENPSYEKLSKTIWEYELDDKICALDGEYHFVGMN